MTHSIALVLALACGTAAAAEVALIGIIGERAAVLAVDGGDPKTVKVGQKWKGITVLSVEKDRATVEVDGRRRVLVQGQHYRSAAALSERQQVTLAADRHGHFVTQGAINGNPVRFLVDTGATSIALPGRDAERLGIDYRKGARGVTQTANGTVAVYRVVFDSVRLGGIELRMVEGVVIEQGLDIALLGMSFLNRVEMKRDGETMTLIRRF
ncbi:MAG: TIGR02281 family clan AA aspartic protease [Betaproteobacteria bacterium]|nr:MAG: TIGR02281 family clan AA aspartic protease [Betaproteobacteria bacterium]